MKKIDELYINPSLIRRVVVQNERKIGSISENSGNWTCDIPGITYSGTYDGLKSELLKTRELEVRNTTEVWLPTVIEVSYSGNSEPDMLKIDTEEGLNDVLEKFKDFIKISSEQQ